MNPDRFAKANIIEPTVCDMHNYIYGILYTGSCKHDKMEQDGYGGVAALAEFMEGFMRRVLSKKGIATADRNPVAHAASQQIRTMFLDGTKKENYETVTMYFSSIEGQWTGAVETHCLAVGRCDHFPLLASTGHGTLRSTD